MNFCAAALAAALLWPAVPLAAQVDDSDLSNMPQAAENFQSLQVEGRREAAVTIFRLIGAPAPSLQGAGEVSGTLLLADRDGKDRPGRLSRARLVGPGASADWVQTDSSGRFAIPVGAGLSGAYAVRVSLDNSYWTFNNPNASGPYEWESPSFTLSPGAGLELGSLRPAPGSENAKLASFI